MFREQIELADLARREDLGNEKDREFWKDCNSASVNVLKNDKSCCGSCSFLNLMAPPEDGLNSCWLYGHSTEYPLETVTIGREKAIKRCEACLELLK